MFALHSRPDTAMWCMPEAPFNFSVTLNINVLVGGWTFASYCKCSSSHLPLRTSRWLEEAGMVRKIADGFLSLLDVPVVQHFICHAKCHRKCFSKWINSKIDFRGIFKKKILVNENSFSQDFYRQFLWYKKWTKDTARGLAERLLCALICRGCHVLLIAPPRKSRRRQ